MATQSRQAADPLFVRFARAIDAAILWRLGLVPVDVPAGLTFPAVDPDRFWQESTVSSPSPVSVARELGYRLRGSVRALDLEAPSRGPGHHPGSTKMFARGYIQERGREGDPLVLLVHGYAVPLPLYEERYIRVLLARGAHAVRIDLPFHLRRRLQGQRSGDGFFGADLELVRGSIRQSVEDAAAIVQWARHELGARVAVLGFSLGGLVTTLLAAHVELDAVAAVAPLADPPQSILDCMPARTRRALGMVGGSGGPWGSDLATARRIVAAGLAPLVPRHFVPVTPGQRITLVAAERDSIVAPETVRRLADSWGTRYWAYPHHGHMTIMAARGLMGRICGRLTMPPEASPLWAASPLRLVR